MSDHARVVVCLEQYQAVHTVQYVIHVMIQVIDKYPERQRVLDKAKEYDPDGIFVSPLIRRVLNRQSLPK
jgi:hypothetical protein